MGVPLDEATKLAEEVRRRVEARVWPPELKFKTRPTVSIGVGMLTVEMDADSFYAAVDRVAIRAKETGRNKVMAAAILEPPTT